MSDNAQPADAATSEDAGSGWRITWTGPRYLSPDTFDRQLPKPELTDTVMARVIDAEIGHRTLKPHDDKPIRFRYLVRIKVQFDFQGSQFTAIPVTWHHEFESRDNARSFCQNELGFAIPEELNDAPAAGQLFELNINRQLPQMCWLSPDMPGKRLSPDFDIVISIDENELQQHRDKEFRTSPVMWGVKFGVLIIMFVYLWWKYGSD